MVRFGSCAKKFSEELNKIGLGCVRHDPEYNSVGTIWSKMQ
jgi:hypothetical protein